MSENLKKSLALTRPLPIIALGVIMPLASGGSLATNLWLGIVSLPMLLLVLAIIALLRFKTQKNGRVGLAIITAAGLLTITKAVLSAIPALEALRIETLAPLMMYPALLAADTDAYDVKKRLHPALFDGVVIALSFMVCLGLTGLLRDLLTGVFMPENAVIKKLNLPPIHMIGLVPGAFLLAAVIARFWPVKKRSAS